MRWMNLEPIIESAVSQKDKNKYCILTHIYGIQKDGNDERNFRAAREMQTQRTDLQAWGRREGEGRMNGESSTVTYILTYKKQIASENLLYDSENSNQGYVTTLMGWEV